MSLELNKEFKKNPLAFFKKYPVVPPSDLGQKQVTLGVIFDEKEIGKDVSDTTTKEVTAAEADPTDKIRWIDFKETKSLNEPGALSFSGTPHPVAGLDCVPIYFLPWKSMRIVSMKLPELSPHDYDAPVERNPNFFFTAAINGCSVFVQGKPTEPTVYHAGIDGTLHRDAAAFWRDCLSRVTRDQGPTGGVTREVNKAQYTKDTSFKGPARTPLAAAYLAWLKDEHKKELKISEVAPWGCVFGIRYGRLWSFYLQENATVTTLEFVKKKDLQDPDARWLKTKKGDLVEKQTKKFLGITTSTVYAAKRTTTAPMRVSDFYPGGPGRFVSSPLFKRMM